MTRQERSFSVTLLAKICQKIAKKISFIFLEKPDQNFKTSENNVTHIHIRSSL